MMRICLVVADATRARIYTYEQRQEPGGPQEEFREERDLVDPARRKRGSELFCDSGGSNRTSQGGHAFDDHRQAHLDEYDANFAREIVGEVERIMRERVCRDLVVVASSRMMGELREQLASLRRTGVRIDELERDFTKLTTPELRYRLAKLGRIPPRPRLAFANR